MREARRVGQGQRREPPPVGPPRLRDHRRRVGPTKTVTEVGSGLNGSRSKLKALLSDPAVGVIVVEHRDRLARFGVEYVRPLLLRTAGAWWWSPRPRWPTTWCETWSRWSPASAPACTAGARPATGPRRRFTPPPVGSRRHEGGAGLSLRAGPERRHDGRAGQPRRRPPLRLQLGLGRGEGPPR